MKRFAYIAVDHEGRTVRGTVEAADWPAAVAELTAHGLRDCQPEVAPADARRYPALGAAQAMELAGYVSELARSGLPMSNGLRAFARDLPAGRVPTALVALGVELDSGRTLEAASKHWGRPCPNTSASWSSPAPRSGRLSETLDAIFAHQRGVHDMSRKFWRAVGYPVALLLLLMLWVLFVALWMIPELEPVWADLEPKSAFVATHEFARVAPPLILASVVAAVLIVAATRFFGGAGAVSRLAAQLPLLGPAWWYCGLTEFCGLVALFLKQGLPLDEALRLTALAARDPAIKSACRRLAEQVTAGQDLASRTGRATIVSTHAGRVDRLGTIALGLGSLARQRTAVIRQSLRRPVAAHSVDPPAGGVSHHRVVRLLRRGPDPRSHVFADHVVDVVVAAVGCDCIDRVYHALRNRERHLGRTLAAGRRAASSSCGPTTHMRCAACCAPPAYSCSASDCLGCACRLPAGGD